MEKYGCTSLREKTFNLRIRLYFQLPLWSSLNAFFFSIILHETCVNHWNGFLAADWKCGQTFANLPFCLTEDKALQGKRMEHHSVCQRHRSSRNGTLKSSCGHSMVPTARAYAGVCLDTRRLQPQELWACLHVCLHSDWISQHWFAPCLVLVSVETCSKLPVK